jgi:hypothetical protein
VYKEHLLTQLKGHCQEKKKVDASQVIKNGIVIFLIACYIHAHGSVCEIFALNYTVV